MYFQWRRGRGGCEKLHGAVIEHAGREDTRVFREVSALGAELQKLGDSVIGAAVEAKVGIVFDWDNWHALDSAVGPVRDKKYIETVRKHYRALYEKNIPVDLVFPDSDISRYKIIIAPMLYMVKPGFAEKIEAFVASGGIFVATFLTGLVDEHDLAFTNGYPGPLSRVLGVWVEEIDALYADQSNTIVMMDGSGSYTCGRIADLLHTAGAQVLATYASDFYAGMPVLTRNTFGKGTAYYLASDPEPAFLDRLYGELLDQSGIHPVLNTPQGIEVAVRVKGDRTLLFVLNHTPNETQIDLGNDMRRDLLTGESVRGVIQLNGYGVCILEQHASR